MQELPRGKTATEVAAKIINDDISMRFQHAFEAIAAAIKQAKREIDAEPNDAVAQRMESLRLTLAKNIAAMLAQQNDKFDKSKFLKAAGGY